MFDISGLNIENILIAYFKIYTNQYVGRLSYLRYSLARALNISAKKMKMNSSNFWTTFGQLLNKLVTRIQPQFLTA